MFDKIKLKIAHFVINKKYVKRMDEPISYNKIVSNSINFFIVMPKDDNDFYHSLEVIRYFQLHHKIITLFLSEHKYNLVPEKEKYRYISYHNEMVNRFNLPNKSLVQRLNRKEFEIVIDLNKNEDVFFSAVSNIVQSKLKIGFNKERSENYYNLQITGSNGDSELIYKSFLSFLLMF
ncbi:MAG: hypothetical protein RDU14_14705 [Melioribacteraceae bacterium]|nr:hypothetical protein [Melioribacteraceae bacterium]